MDLDNELPVEEDVCRLAVDVAYDLKAKIIISLTQTGRSGTIFTSHLHSHTHKPINLVTSGSQEHTFSQTAKWLSKYRPDCLVLAAVPRSQAARQLLVYRGVFPLLVDEHLSREQAVDRSTRESLCVCV